MENRWKNTRPDRITYAAKAPSAPMRISFTAKLLFLLSTVAALLVITMVLATRWQFQSGFKDYLTDAEVQRLEPLRQALNQQWQQQQSWNFIDGHSRVWAHFLSKLPDSQIQTTQDTASAALPGTDLARGRGQFGRYRPGLSAGVNAVETTDSTGLGARLRLLNAQKRPLVGNPKPSGDERHIQLKNQGQTIGYLGLSPPTWLNTELDRRFQQQQNKAILLAGITALILALILGLPTARHLIAPVKDITRSTRQLRDGQLQTRVNTQRSDELGQLAKDINALAASLQDNEDFRRQAMADVSHELRTPVSVLRAQIEAMQDGLRACDHDNLARLKRSIDALAELIDDLYQLALTDSGNLQYQHRPLDLAELLQSAQHSFQNSAKQQGLELHLMLPENATLNINGDPKRLNQLLHNLLKNALRYTDSKTADNTPGRIEIHASVQAQHIQLLIQDSAPGVKDSQRQRLFERFYRVESSRDRAKGGAGLGLAICREIVHAHRGNIQLKASPLGGLAVHIQLPSNDKPKTEQPQATST